MNWINKINSALEYIELHLTEEIDIDCITKEVNSSRFHFSRIFKIVTDKTIKQYIRERRITLATQDLVIKGLSISEISERYQYDSPAAFSKAFKRFNGISPSKLKSNNLSLVAIPPIRVELSILGREKLRYKIIDRESFSVTGLSNRVKKGTEDIKKIWDNCTLDNVKEKEIVGITYNWNEDSDDFNYLISTSENIDDHKNSVHIDIPAAKWAVFTTDNVSESEITTLWENIYNNWFPATRYIQADKPVLETLNNSVFSIWIPLELLKI